MAHQILWNKVILEEFINIGGLTQEEEEVLRTRYSGMSIIEQSVKLGMSRSKVNYITKRIREKYDGAQKYSSILPPRKCSSLVRDAV